jgi:hypothetical protein
MSIPGDDVRMDAMELAERIESLVTGYLGISMSVSRRTLATTIRRYVEARQWAGPYNVRVVGPADVYFPDDWSAHDEEVWQWWLSDKVTTEQWEEYVTGPVFGTDIRVWETMGAEWRQELLAFLTHWVVRSEAIVSRVDPLPRPEEEVDADGRLLSAEDLDPYLADQSGKGGRRRR